MDRPLAVALVVSGALFMELLDGTVISTALPQMAASFHENPVNLSAGMTAYLLTLAVFIPVSGWCADRFGSRTIFASAIGLFVGASILCGLSQTLPEFTAARILQGIGGAMMVPVGRLVVFRSTAKADLLRAMAFITTPGLIAPVLGPAIGGFITTYASWRWIFFLNIPLGIVGLGLTFALMTNQREATPRPFDLLGFALSGTSLALLMYGLDAFGRGDQGVAVIAGSLAAGAVLGVLALRHAQRHPHPMLDLSALRLKTFAIGLIWGGMPFRLVLGATPLLWPLLFQVGLGMSAFHAGLVILTCAAGDVSAKAFVNPAVRRFGFRTLLVGVTALIALCTLGFVAIGPATPLFASVVLLVLIGVLRSVNYTSMNALAYSDVTPAMMSSASTLVSTIQQLSFGIAVAFGALVLRGAALVHGRASLAFTLDDLHLTFGVMALVALLGAVNFARLQPNDGVAVSGHRGAEAQRA
jgi:EmrB/QacA subfamily drug resistance transporter